MNSHNPINLFESVYRNKLQLYLGKITKEVSKLRSTKGSAKRLINQNLKSVVLRKNKLRNHLILNFPKSGQRCGTVLYNTNKVVKY